VHDVVDFSLLRCRREVRQRIPQIQSPKVSLALGSSRAFALRAP
jgi:hypothetical protein